MPILEMLDSLHVIDKDAMARRQALCKVLEEMHPNGIDVIHLFAYTDGNEAWYGMEIDKKKYRIVLEDETEDSVYLKIVKKQTGGEEE